MENTTNTESTVRTDFEARLRRSEESLTSARQRLAENAAEAVVDRLAEMLNAVVRAEVAVMVDERLAAMAERRPESDDASLLTTVAESFTEMVLMNGADDTWSGRGNDLRRVRFDALRDRVVTLRYEAAARAR